MRIVAMMMMGVGFLAACSSGDVELVQVENPEVEQVEETTRAPTVALDSTEESTDAAATAEEVEVEPSATDGDDQSVEDVDLAEAAEESAPNEQPAVEEVAQPSEDEPIEDELNEDEPIEDELNQDELEDEPSVDPVDLDVGIVEVDPSDSWCDAAAKVNENFATLNGIDHGDPQQLEAAFVQVYNAIAVTAALAPPEIAIDAEAERWVWDQMVILHEDADWGESPLPQDRITELGEQNLPALQAVDDYTARTCA